MAPATLHQRRESTQFTTIENVKDLHGLALPHQAVDTAVMWKQTDKLIRILLTNCYPFTKKYFLEMPVMALIGRVGLMWIIASGNVRGYSNATH